MTPLYVSFYTPDYAGEAAELVATLDAHGLEYVVTAMPSAGNWVANCGRKPYCIRSAMALYPGRPIIWLDADARVRQYPALFDGLDCDFAAHWRHGTELLSGTLYFNPTAAALSLVDAWIREQDRRRGEWDQRVLADVVAGMTGLKTLDLPWGYCRIFDGKEQGEPVIEHMQASRRFRN